MNKKIWLSLAHMGGHEQDFIKEAFDTNWVVPLGPSVNAFEAGLSAYLGENRHAVALSAGTAALHLGLIQLGVGAGDEVICQSFTFAASANPVVYCGGVPVFVDSEEETWNIDPVLLEKAIDLLIFISQTPDYRMPATSVILQHRLGLSEKTIAFDINLGCSAFLYGMSVVYSMMEKSGLRKALILDGETRSKVYSPKDRRTAFLFGDGGVAALVERNERFGKSYFSLNSDGSRADLIKINGGGYRNPSSVETLRERVIDEYGNIRNDEQGYMDGGDVFNFVIREIPRDIKQTLAFAGTDKEALDFYVFHQANNFINSYLAKKLKLDAKKIPSCVEKFGNTSSVSVPLTIASELRERMCGERKLLLSAFGVGMTWATAVVPFVDCKVSELVEV